MTNKYTSQYDNGKYGDYYYPETKLYALATTVPPLRSSVEDINYDGYYKSGTYLHFVFNAQGVHEGDYIDVPLYCYPGYQAIYNDTENLTIVRGENDIIRILLPEGVTSGSIRVKYAGFWYFHLGDAITAVTIIAIVAVPAAQRRRAPKRSRKQSKEAV